MMTALDKYWSRLSLAYRGAAIVTIPAICLVATLTAWSWSKSEGQKWETQIATSKDRVDTADDVVDILLTTENAMQGYLLSGESAFLKSYEDNQRKIPATVSKLAESFAQNRAEAAKVSRVKTHVDTVTKLTAQLPHTDSAATNLSLLIQIKQEIELLRRQIDDLQQVERRLLSQERQELYNFQSSVQSLQQLATIAGLMSTWGALFLFWSLERELKEREQRIEVGENTLEALNNDVVDAIVLIDSADNIEKVNPAAQEVFGYNMQQLLGSPLLQLLIPPAEMLHPLPDLKTWLADLPKLGRVWQTQAYHRDGHQFPIELSLSEIPHKQQWIAIVRDVSAQKQLLQQLQEHLQSLKHLNLSLFTVNASLEHRNQELAQFAHVAAHDLKTPVRGISTLTEWIEEEVKHHYPSPQLQHYLQLLRQRIYRIDGFIDGLWEFASLGQTPVPLETVDVPELLQQMLQACSIPPSFEIVLEIERVSMTTCKRHLCKVIKELIQNAIKHHDRDRGKLVVAVKDVEGQLHFTFADDGPGIPPEFHQRVFRLFETVEPRDACENVGVGLTIAKKIIELCNGKIWLENIPSGRGLAVRFILPQHSG